MTGSIRDYDTVAILMAANAIAFSRALGAVTAIPVEALLTHQAGHWRDMAAISPPAVARLLHQGADLIDETMPA